VYKNKTTSPVFFEETNKSLRLFVVNYETVLEKINTKMEIVYYFTQDKASTNTAASQWLP
jgi:hypothetical protein